MSKQEVILSESSEKALVLINSKLGDKLNGNQLLDGCIAFSLFIMTCCHDDGLFEENLNNIMGTSDYTKFFTGEGE
ncbi:hypothetical protein KAR91_12275 [Candidatus Pacearchaeota archaeon]|nr:hypothetical protein [Candidatus Pacearchaeota archaeon]